MFHQKCLKWESKKTLIILNENKSNLDHSNEDIILDESDLDEENGSETDVEDLLDQDNDNYIDGCQTHQLKSNIVLAK